MSGQLASLVAGADLPSVDEAAIAQLRELMEEEFAELMQTFVDNAPRELLRLREAALACEFGNVAAGSHTLKGSSANLGLPRLSALAKSLELLARSGQDCVALRQRLSELEEEFSRLLPRLRDYAEG
jgi:HPt (histidine-containing phosphotransfer) domain-containing protein